MPIDPEKRREYLDWVTNRGTGTRVYDDDDRVDRIPFVSPMLTWAATGGMPIGHIGRWYGPEGSGKSLVNWGLSYCAQNYPQIMTEWYELEIKFWERQAPEAEVRRCSSAVSRTCSRNFPDGMSVLLFDTEQRAQLDFAAKLGVSVKKDRSAGAGGEHHRGDHRGDGRRARCLPRHHH